MREWPCSTMAYNLINCLNYWKGIWIQMQNVNVWRSSIINTFKIIIFMLSSLWIKWFLLVLGQNAGNISCKLQLVDITLLSTGSKNTCCSWNCVNQCKNFRKWALSVCVRGTTGCNSNLTHIISLHSASHWASLLKLKN